MPRRYVVRRAASVIRDIAAIRRHLVRTYQEFGDAQPIATERAGERIRDAFSYMQGFATYPYRGTVHPELQGDIRHVTDKGFIYYFEIDELVDEVKILAVFFRGEDHLRKIAERLSQ
ncbi:MAG: type II toxin-antitoxin system RelE/ParE family toxin [Proteobacteria bacterium]|nr:type II toxin-antitoxin system RelE/ParE family toxin [Pseudomonadota bacterium]